MTKYHHPAEEKKRAFAIILRKALLEVIAGIEDHILELPPEKSALASRWKKVREK